MAASKVRAARVKVYAPPEGVKADEKVHVYTYDVFHESFLPGKSFDNLERAVQYQRHEQERIYTEQEAIPELFDLPFISNDSDLLARATREADYRNRLVKELGAEARGRARRH